MVHINPPHLHCHQPWMGPWEGILTALLLPFSPPLPLQPHLCIQQMMSLTSVAFQCPSDKIRLPSRSCMVWPPASAPTSFSSKKLSTSFSFFHLQHLCLPLLPSQLLRGWGLPQRGRAGSHPHLFFLPCHAGSSFPNQGSNLHPLQWEHGILTTR